MTDIDATIVHCPVGHGLFIVSGSPESRKCPGCGAYLMEVDDDEPLGGVRRSVGAPALDRATEPVNDRREPLRLTPEAGFALIHSA